MRHAPNQMSDPAQVAADRIALIATAVANGATFQWRTWMGTAQDPRADTHRRLAGPSR